MGTANDRADGIRLRALIVVLWRAGQRISEALALAENDMDARRGAVLIRHGKGDKRREVGIDRTAALAGVRRRFAPPPTSTRTRCRDGSRGPMERT
jgi:site-specific recombinase XerD